MQSSAIPRSKKDEEKKNSESKSFLSYIISYAPRMNFFTSSAESLNSSIGGPCDSGACSPMAPATQPMSSHASISHALNEEFQDEKESHSLGSSNLVNIILESAKKGLATGFYLSVLTEPLTEVLKYQKYTQEEINWIIQFIRMSALIDLGSSPVIAVASPVFNYLLKECVGISPKRADLITSGVMIGASAFTSPLGIAQITALTTSIASTVVGSYLGNFAYQLAKKSFFSLNKMVLTPVVEPSRELTPTNKK